MASAFVDVPPISPSAVSMTGSRMLRLAASYFGLCTNQAPSTLTPCISKACWVSIRPPATPGVLLLIHWVICVQQWTPPSKVKVKIVPCILWFQVGALLLWHFEVTYLTFPFFGLWLFSGGAADCERTICLSAFPPFFYIVMYVLQLLQRKKRFSINKHQDGEFLGNLTRTSLNI